MNVDILSLENIQSICKLDHTKKRQFANILSLQPIRSHAIYEILTNCLELPANYPNLQGTSSRGFPVFLQPWSCMCANVKVACRWMMVKKKHHMTIKNTLWQVKYTQRQNPTLIKEHDRLILNMRCAKSGRFNGLNFC